MTTIAEHRFCPECGTEFGSDPSTEGLCPRCLLGLAILDSQSSSQDTDAPIDGSQGPTPGRIIGRRYQIRELLGRGGMGEVWRAFDLKLQVDVALKAVRPERLRSSGAREQLRQEVRSAREVVSQNVCRIFDLVVEEAYELVSMEFIDGTTLADTIEDRGPLGLQEARDIAAQFLAGLEAIHQAGLVHRDFKPENVMITHAGRVVIMDFGLAKGQTGAEASTIFGTPPYMAPEQARGASVDARADVFSAGIVLAEMLSIGARDSTGSRRALWQAVRETPPRVPDGPWAPALRQALASKVEARYLSARALAHALEEVAFRVPALEEKRPYPGLAAFTEHDADFFFGREFEVETIWKKIKRPRLLALVGPSGAGKSSFIRAGILATLPTGWAAVYCAPGTRPFQSLAHALVPAFSGDTQALQDLLRFDDPETALALVSRWRQRHQQALIAVDQFEELFTLSGAVVQDAFARLLLRLILDADVHVLVSLRDDFLVHCHRHEALASVFAGLTPLGMPDQNALRRALVQPALACGYRFEDDALPEEMVRDVGSERGALPLLAFAASRLWDKRDRERGLLLRQSYRDIGGVGGALAQHAEETLEAIGRHRTAIVREVFRNLVTAEGTRASREIDELLSIFGNADNRVAAREVLDALVGARLLTTYEAVGDADRQVRRVEIIHESLLSAWPRLVRWQTQDANAAQFRDQLRDAARVWNDRGQPEDLLWSGSAYRDFAVWREHYAGGLSAAEEAFGEAATRRAERRLRRRRIIAAALLGAAAIVAVSTSALWQRSEISRRRAEAEVLRSEASHLLALGEVELDAFPTGALAYALKSLELADTDVGRLFALRALQQAPTARLTALRAPGEIAIRSYAPAFSPNGEWLAFGGFWKAQVLHRDGGAPLVLGDYAQAGGASTLSVGFGPQSDVLVGDRLGDVRVWSIPQGRELKRGALERGPSAVAIRDRGFLTMTWAGGQTAFRWWPFGSGESHLVGSVDSLRAPPVDGYQGALVYADGRRIFSRPFDDWRSAPRLLAETPDDVMDVALSRSGQRLAAIGRSGQMRVWDSPYSTPPRVIVGTGVWRIALDGAGTRLAGIVRDERRDFTRVWDLNALAGAEPMVLRRNGQFASPADLIFDPSGDWLVTAHGGDAAFWPLRDNAPIVLGGHNGSVTALAFAKDGQVLISASADGTVRSWPLSEIGGVDRIIVRRGLFFPDMAVDAGSGRIALADGLGHVLILSAMGEIERELDGVPVRMSTFVAFGDRGRLVAAAPYAGPVDQRLIRVWNLETGTMQVLPPVRGAFDGTDWGFDGVQFLDQDRLLASVGRKGLLMYDLRRGSGRALNGPSGRFAVSRDGKIGVGVSVDPEAAPGTPTDLIRFDTSSEQSTTLHSYGSQGASVSLDATGTLMATGSVDGSVRIGAVSGGEPHIFFGHEGWVRTVAFSPDGRWLASGGDDRKIRLWPVPASAERPLHMRDRDRLLALLRSRTNVRVVADPGSSTGWKLDRDPFPGWARLPER